MCFPRLWYALVVKFEVFTWDSGFASPELWNRLIDFRNRSRVLSSRTQRVQLHYRSFGMLETRQQQDNRSWNRLGFLAMTCMPLAPSSVSQPLNTPSPPTLHPCPQPQRPLTVTGTCHSLLWNLLLRDVVLQTSSGMLRWFSYKPSIKDMVLLDL